MLQRIIRVVRDLTGITNDIYKYWSVSVWWYKGAKPDCIMLFLRYSRAKTEKTPAQLASLFLSFEYQAFDFEVPKFWKSLCYWSFSGWVFIVSCSGQTSRRPYILMHFVRTLSHPLFQWVETCWNRQPPAPSRDTCEKHWNGLPRKRVMRRLTALVNGPLYADRTYWTDMIINVLRINHDNVKVNQQELSL